MGLCLSSGAVCGFQVRGEQVNPISRWGGGRAEHQGWGCGAQCAPWGGVCPPAFAVWGQAVGLRSSLCLVHAGSLT